MAAISLASSAAAQDQLPPTPSEESIDPDSTDADDGGTANAPVAPTSHSSTIDALLADALANDPALGAMHERWLAQRDASEAAGDMRPRPVLNYTGYILPVETREGPMRHQLAIAQAFLWPGTRDDARRPAIAEAEAVAAGFEAAIIMRQQQLRNAIVAHFRATILLDVMHEQRELIGDVATHIEDTLAYSNATYADLLRALLSEELVGDAIARAETARAVAREQIAVLSSRDALSLPDRFDSADPWLVGQSLPELDELITYAQEHHPDMRQFEARADAALARADVAANGAQSTPVISLGWTWIDATDIQMGETTTRTSGRDALMVGLSLPLPTVRSTYDAQVLVNEHQAIAFSHDADARWQQLESGIRTAFVTANDAIARLDRIETTYVPMAGEAADLLAIDLAHGNADHSEYLLALEQQLALEQRHVEALADLLRSRADLDALTAGALSATQERRSESMDQGTEPQLIGDWTPVETINE